LKSRKTIPPGLATWFLQRFLRDDLFEEVSGDLEEKFHLTLETKTVFRAKLNYWRQVFLYLRPFAIRKFSNSNNQNFYPMYKSYFTSSLRSMKNNKMHASINIAGLSVGIAVAMIIGIWINDELSYEKHFDNYETTGRVLQNVTNNGEVQTWWSVPMPLSEELRKNYGNNFEYVVLMTSSDDGLLSYEKEILSRSGIFAEPDFTNLFTLQMIRGSRDALKDQSSIIISASTAKAIFGDDDPMGKVMVLNKNMTVNVAGVYKDIPLQSEFNEVHFVAPWDLLYAKSGWISTMQDPWRPNAFSLYVGIAKNRTFDQVSATIKDAKLKRVSAALAKKKPALFVHPMSEWHLYSDFREGVKIGGRITYVWLFGVIGIFVVIMACINFMNLSTARSEKRAKEVSIRKAIGSFRTQLIQQFLTESVLTTLLAFIIAVLMVQLTLPWFNQAADKHSAIPWTNWSVWLVCISFCTAIGLIAGSYPAMFLSAIKPGKALKNSAQVGKSGSMPRKVMVVIQFTVSVVLIIGTAVVFKQIQFAKDRPIGYETDGLVAITNAKEIHDHLDKIKEELVGANVITAIGEADAPTTELWSSSSSFSWDGKDPDLSVDFSNTGVSYDYGETIGWEILQGRNFDRALASDSIGLIINEATAKYMGFENPVGETIRWYDRPCRVIGVVKNIISRSPFEPERPTLYYLNSGQGNFALMRLNPKISAQEAISKIETLFKKYNPDEPFHYRFMDDAFAQKFGNEERVGKLGGVFASLAIFISCLGIFGLSSFTAEQRTKEIGIRKIHGASIFQLWRLMSKDFLWLVAISCIIASPIAYKLLSSWVSRYTYHIEVSWTIFFYAGLCTLIVTMITVSWHTVHAAKVNPVKSLRSE
jgi:ABC-type antimicrobial peptide transport system permease subunit